MSDVGKTNIVVMWTVGPDDVAEGDRIFVSIGSASNVAGNMPEKTPEEIQAFEETYGLGAAWGEEAVPAGARAGEARRSPRGPRPPRRCRRSRPSSAARTWA